MHVDDRHDFSDISQENIAYFIEKVEQNLGKSFNEDPLTILKKYELIKEDKLTWGSYLLFTSNNSAITAFQIGRFKDPITIIDNIDINTNLFIQIDTAIEFIKKHLNKKTPFFAKELETSVKNIERWIKLLKDEQKIEFKGAPKTGGYILKASNAN